MRSIPGEVRASLLTVSSSDPIVPLLTVQHPLLASPIHMASNSEDILHDNLTFIAYPFSLQLPDEADGKSPQAIVTISNIGADLVREIHHAGGFVGGSIRLMLYDQATKTVFFSATMSVVSCEMGAKNIKFVLGYDNLLEMPAVRMTYRPETADGIF